MSAETANRHRTSVCIPLDVREAMNEIPGGAINWSAVATQAFRDAIEKFNKKGGKEKYIADTENILKLEKALAKLKGPKKKGK